MDHRAGMGILRGLEQFSALVGSMQLISEYKKLPDAEKQKYKARAAAEKAAFEEAQALLAEMEEMGDMGL